MNSHEKWLRQAANEIRSEGHAGWGNTCEFAADKMAQQQARIETLEKSLIEIAESGCEGRFHDDQDICSTHPHYPRTEWCNPCIANAALLEAADE